MLVEEIIGEGYRQVWARSSHGVVRKYRCTDGAKKGRVVAKPSTCGKPVGQQKSHNLKKTRRTKGRVQAVKRSLTIKRPTSKRITTLNKAIKPKRKVRR